MLSIRKHTHGNFMVGCEKAAGTKQMNAEDTSEQTICFYVRLHHDANHLYQAIYLKERSMHSLIRAVRGKFPEALGCAVVITLGHPEETEIVVDECIIQHLPTGQDLAIKFIVPGNSVSAALNDDKFSFYHSPKASHNSPFWRNVFDEFWDGNIPFAETPSTQLEIDDTSTSDCYVTDPITRLSYSPEQSQQLSASCGSIESLSAWNANLIWAHNNASSEDSWKASNGDQWGFDPIVQPSGPRLTSSDTKMSERQPRNVKPIKRKVIPHGQLSEEKKQHIRDKNRDAATKFRHKKKELQQNQEADVRRMELENGALRVTIGELQAQIEFMRTLAKEHTVCMSEECVG